MAKKDKLPDDQLDAAVAVEMASLSEALEDYDGYVQAQAQDIWQYDELPFILSLEEQLFVRSFVIDRNHVAAMRRLGHRGEDSVVLKRRAQKYLDKADVQNAVDFLAKRMMEKLDITAEKVQRQIAAVAFFDPREVMQFDKYGVTLLHSRYWTAEQAAAIKTIKQGQNGVEIVLYDRLKANEMLAKQLGVQPDESDSAQSARLAADETMDRIANILGRLAPGGKDAIARKIAERRAIRDGRSETVQ
jgi:phage terminase small subunit